MTGTFFTIVLLAAVALMVLQERWFARRPLARLPYRVATKREDLEVGPLAELLRDGLGPRTRVRALELYVGEGRVCGRICLEVDGRALPDPDTYRALLMTLAYRLQAQAFAAELTLAGAPSGPLCWALYAADGQGWRHEASALPWTSLTFPSTSLRPAPAG